MIYKDWNMNDRHAYFILVDKDVDLSDYINVYNVQDHSFNGSWEEPPYEDIRYDTEVDDDFDKFVHIVNYAYQVGYDEKLEEEVLNFNIDGNKYFCIPLENCDDEFDTFVEKSGYSYPIDNELDGWWDTVREAKIAIETYIERVAHEKACEQLEW